MSRGGADLALLLLGGFRFMADTATDRLAERGHAGVRPAHDFALRAIAAGAGSVSEVGRRTSVSKQAAAKTVAFLEESGYVRRTPDPRDRRRARLTVTDRGNSLMSEGEAVFDELRSEWEALVGSDRITDLQSALVRLLGAENTTVDDMTKDVPPA
ncbi:MarR family winged helix-turn-helix transcriptional regulator [Paramicrobacterium chengjingii]|uniref:Winged helix-turn-helix transcriptional regulator n=1 Tax=Paramicrobacterium chengjingii TaxID=2769067 RepID=A0ABX6YIH6_9MICO|nr:MarR family winged helix-turn-helix transcriptional regulator [Microbacterium chengjingii]QPZ38621.1 winged helix-turn-helix transcriptional regulator [Microbacterium chengjingii]